MILKNAISLLALLFTQEDVDLKLICKNFCSKSIKNLQKQNVSCIF